MTVTVKKTQKTHVHQTVTAYVMKITMSSVHVVQNT